MKAPDVDPSAESNFLSSKFVFSRLYSIIPGVPTQFKPYRFAKAISKRKYPANGK